MEREYEAEDNVVHGSRLAVGVHDMTEMAEMWYVVDALHIWWFKREMTDGRFGGYWRSGMLIPSLL